MTSIVSFWPHNFATKYYHAVLEDDGTLLSVPLNPLPGSGAVLIPILGIENIALTTAGTGYAIGNTITLAGGNFTAPAQITVDTVSGGAITGWHVTNPGAYSSPPVSPVAQGSTSGTGSGATFTLTSFTIVTLQVVAPGLGYSNPEIFIQFGGGTGATATPTLSSGGAIIAVVMGSNGTGYTIPPDIVIIDNQPQGNRHIAFIDAAGNLTTNPGFTTIKTTQWGGQYLLIIDPVKGYFIWDNSILYGPSTLAPIVTITDGGSGYTSPPSVTVSGGSGSGATFVATLDAFSQVVSTITLLNPGTGYLATDTFTLNLTITGGGGTGATATVTLMPIGITGGTDIITYQGRVWIISGIKLFFSAAGGVSDFNIPDGGGIAQNTESTLRAEYTALLTSNGFLYPFGDSSVDVINNVNTTFNQSSGDSITTFNNQNVDPNNGTSWPNSAINFGRAMIYANPSGIYAMYGGTAQKISQPLDGIFIGLPQDQLPSSSLAIIFGIKCFCILLRAQDYLGVTRPMIFCYDGKKWFATSQNNDNIIQINTLIIDSQEQTWATDGQSIFQCFAEPDPTLLKTYQTKLWSGENYVITKECQRLTAQVQLNPVSGLQQYPANISFTMSIDSDQTSTVVQWEPMAALEFANNSGGELQFQSGLLTPQDMFLTVPNTAVRYFDLPFSGKLIGQTMTTTYPDFTFVKSSVMYVGTTAF